MEINNKTAPVTGQQDRNTISLDLMGRMKLHGMAEAFRESLAGTTPQSMTADTFLSMLLAREWDYRAQAAIVRLTRNAAFRYKAYLERIDYLRMAIDQETPSFRAVFAHHLVTRRRIDGAALLKQRGALHVNQTE